jgi:hypothetical protein
MQDLARVTGDPLTVTIGNDTFILKALQIGRLGIIQNEILQCKRRAVLGLAEIECESVFDPARQQQIRAAARNEARAIAYSKQDDLMEFISSPEGVSFCIWLLFEQEYPGRLQRAEVLTSLLPKLGEQITQVMSLLLVSFGMDAVGNGTGPSEATGQVAGAAKEAGGEGRTT